MGRYANYERAGFDRVRSYVLGKTAYYLTPCVYCGEPATDREHVFPYSYIQGIKAAGLMGTEILVPSCSECNTLAGARVFETFEEKRDYIHKRIADRYADILDMPTWSDDELDELTGQTRRYVAGCVALKAVILDRLAYNADAPF